MNKGHEMFLHVDINAYFATLLQQETPSLRGKPIGVVKDVGRTCIIAASKEAKLKGIKTGCSSVEAMARCPDLLLLPADFGLYAAATFKLKALFESVAPSIEIFSLDESFIPYEELRLVHQDPIAFGLQIQEKIRQVLGEWVTCNVGIGPSRLLAKMVGETSVKGSVVQVTEESKASLLSQVSFADVCGVGWALERRLSSLGITHPYQINFMCAEDLLRHFGPFWSKELANIAMGRETTQLARLATPLTQMKGVGRSITLFELTGNDARIRQVLYNLSSEVMHKVRTMDLMGRQISLLLVGHGRAWSRHITLQSAIRQTKEFTFWIDQLFKQWESPFPLIKFAVHLGLIQSWKSAQLPLAPEWWQRERAEAAVDSVNRRYGLYTIRSGQLTDTKTLIHPEVTGFLGDRIYQMG